MTGPVRRRWAGLRRALIGWMALRGLALMAALACGGCAGGDRVAPPSTSPAPTSLQADIVGSAGPFARALDAQRKTVGSLHAREQRDAGDPARLRQDLSDEAVAYRDLDGSLAAISSPADLTNDEIQPLIDDDHEVEAALGSAVARADLDAIQAARGVVRQAEDRQSLRATLVASYLGVELTPG